MSIGENGSRELRIGQSLIHGSFSSLMCGIRGRCGNVEFEKRERGKRGEREMSGLGWVECLGGDENGLLGSCWVRAC